MLVQIIFIQSSQLWMVFARFFGLRRTQVCFLLHLVEVNFEPLSSFPIQRPVFKTLNFHLSGGVSFPHYVIVLHPHLLNVSTVFPTDISDMTTLYKPIFGLGGGIRHMSLQV